MKKILLTLLLLVGFCFCASAQTVYKKYGLITIGEKHVPKYLIGYTDDKVDTLGIVLSIEQAQKVDNSLDLLNLYRNVHTSCDSTVKLLVATIEDYKKVNLVAQQTIRTYEMSVNDLKLQINNLNEQIVVKDSEIRIKASIVKDKDNIINVDKLQIRHLKNQKTGLMVGGVTVTVGLVYILLGHPGIR
jgi:hypothetical protein